MTGILITFNFASMAFLIWAMISGYQGIAVRAHITIALGATALSVFAHSLTMMYTFAVGRMIRQAVEKANLDSQYIQQTKQYRKKVVRVAILGMIFVMTNTVLGGGAHTRAFPLIIHHAIALCAIAVNAYAVFRETQYLIANHLLGHRVAREFEQK